MSSKLDKLYSLFTIRPKELTAWEKEDWTEEQSGKVRRGYYIPKREIFCRALNRDGSLCKSAVCPNKEIQIYSQLMTSSKTSSLINFLFITEQYI